MIWIVENFAKLGSVREVKKEFIRQFDVSEERKKSLIAAKFHRVMQRFKDTGSVIPRETGAKHIWLPKGVKPPKGYY